MKKHLLPIVILVILWIFIVATNYTPGTWLTGWDNLHPEFDFGLNIKRSLFAVWQEYQGLGLQGAMGHAADLPRQLILFGLSSFLPISTLRYVWTFFMALAGPLGSYFLISYIFKKQQKTGVVPQLSALVGSLFYLFSLATVQTFFAPYEALVTHYGALPWLIWATIRALDHFNPKNILIFACVHILFMAQSYVPTLFLVYLIILAALCIQHFLTHKSRSLKRILTIGIVTICINAFWLFPFVFNSLTNNQVIVNSKINQMATEENFLRNQKYGTLWDTLTLKNFWFEASEFYPTEGTTQLMLAPWIDHLNSPIGKAAILIVVVMTFTGAVLTLKNKQTRIWGVLGLIGFTMLASDTLPFSWFVSILRTTVPLLAQFFRFPFTKWSSELVLMYSIFIAVFALTVVNYLSRFKRYLTYLAVLVLLIPVVTIGFPMLQGKLIDKHMQTKIPQEYFDLFAYFKTQPLGRIANLPQNYFWDWKYYRWGSLGSGFLWYGIEQPILDRAFDVWSSQNENYYWELSYALYSKDTQQVNNVLRKYDITYVLIDSSLISSNNFKSLLQADTKFLFDTNPQYQLSARFEHIFVYKVKLPKSDKFVTVQDALPSVGPVYPWGDFDSAYAQIGDYIASVNNVSFYFPYVSLFTKRAVAEREFTIEETENGLELVSKQVPQALSLIEPTGFKVVDRKYIYTIAKDQLVYDSHSATQLTAENAKQCGSILEGTINSQNLTEDDQKFIRLQALNNKSCLSFVVPNLEHRNGYVVAVEYRHVTGRPLVIAVINETAEHTELETQGTETSGWQTAYFVIPKLASDGLGYQIYFSNQGIGRHESINDIKSVRIYNFDYDQVANLFLQDNSVGQKASSYKLPLYAKHPNTAFYEVKLTQDQNTTLVLQQSYNPGWIAWVKTNEFPYFARLTNHVLVNNWANGWLLEEPKSADQMKYEPSTNSSEKANTESRRRWSESITIYLFFWPQLLEFLGLALLPIPFLYLVKNKKTTK